MAFSFEVAYCVDVILWNKPLKYLIIFLYPKRPSAQLEDAYKMVFLSGFATRSLQYFMEIKMEIQECISQQTWLLFPSTGKTQCGRPKRVKDLDQTRCTRNSKSYSTHHSSIWTDDNDECMFSEVERIRREALTLYTT